VGDVYDEIVIEQEAQMLPTFVVHVKKTGTAKLTKSIPDTNFEDILKTKFPFHYNTLHAFKIGKRLQDYDANDISPTAQHIQIYKGPNPSYIQPPHWVLSSVLYKDCMNQSWKEIYNNIIDGKLSVVLQTYNRELNRGFFRSYFDSLVTYQKQTDDFKVMYFPFHSTYHAPKVEFISHADYFKRFRNVPVELQDHSPYFIFETKESQRLQVGDWVEIQWKNNDQSCFGLWFGIMKMVSDKEVSIQFPHFDPGNAWHLLTFHPHLKASTTLSSVGGFVGGIRLLSTNQKRDMERYISVEPNFF